MMVLKKMSSNTIELQFSLDENNRYYISDSSGEKFNQSKLALINSCAEWFEKEAVKTQKTLEVIDSTITDSVESIISNRHKLFTTQAVQISGNRELIEIILNKSGFFTMPLMKIFDKLSHPDDSSVDAKCKKETTNVLTRYVDCYELINNIFEELDLSTVAALLSLKKDLLTVIHESTDTVRCLSMDLEHQSDFIL